MLQCVAGCCSGLHCVTVSCSVLHCDFLSLYPHTDHESLSLRTHVLVVLDMWELHCYYIEKKSPEDSCYSQASNNYDYGYGDNGGYYDFGVSVCLKCLCNRVSVCVGVCLYLSFCLFV